MPTLKKHDFSLPRSRQIEETTRREGTFCGVYDLSGNCYTGQWHRDERQGLGTLTLKSAGDKYLGQWQNGKRHGYGMLRRLNPSTEELELVYEGQWRDGVPHGRGVGFLPDGSYYEGDYVEGKRCGHGTMVVAPEGSHYTGEWLNEEPNGFGVWTYSNGNYYEGEFQHGIFHGCGIYVFPSEKCMLRGVWKNGRWFSGEMVTIPDDSELLNIEHFWL